MLLAFPSMCLAFQYHMQVAQIYGELRPEIKTVRNMAWIVFAAKCLIVPIYLATAFAGYFMFRGYTPPDILAGPYAQSATGILLARLLVSLNAVLGVPLYHH